MKELLNSKPSPSEFYILETMENAKKVNEDLFNAYNAAATKCYNERDFDGYAYWLDRAYAMIREKHQLDKDITKLKGD